MLNPEVIVPAFKLVLDPTEGVVVVELEGI
jgi:hypothetical protein